MSAHRCDVACELAELRADLAAAGAAFVGACRELERPAADPPAADGAGCRGCRE